MRERYFALDAVRGIAALAVLALHLSGGRFPQRGYLAVDVFFVLSGFVISHAYEKRLENGLGVGRFARLRAIRLYPLVFLGVGLSVAVNVGLAMIGHPHLNFTMLQVICGALLVPYVANSVDMYLVLSPTWSLFNELTVNVAYAALAKGLTNRGLVLFSIVSGLILFPAIVHSGSAELGPYRGTLMLGLVRTSFSFAVGVLLYRYRSRAQLGASWLLGSLACMVALFSFGGSGVYDGLAVGLAIPLVIAVGAHVKIEGRLCALLGDLSYPVYILHWPIRTAIFATGIQEKLPEPLFLLLSSALVCGCAWLALKFYDEPIRSALKLPQRHPVTAP